MSDVGRNSSAEGMKGGHSEKSDSEKKTSLDGEKLEVRMNITDFRKMNEMFSEDDDEFMSLTREQFIEAMVTIDATGTRDEFGQMFDRIDVTKEGIVNWDMFASHMLLEFYEKDDKVKSTQVPHWKDLKVLSTTVHKDVVQGVTYLKSNNRYIAISKEGSITMWNMDLRLQRSLRTSTESCRMKDLWVTDFVPLPPNISKIALAFTSKEIAIYDMSSKIDFNCQYKITDLHSIPLCLDFWLNPSNPNEAILVWGDVSGCVNAINFSSASIALFERPTVPAGDKQDPCLTVKLIDIQKKLYKNAKFTKHNGHTEWVRQVKYVPGLECFLSCATTYNNSVVIGWLEKSNPTMKTYGQAPLIKVVKLNKFQITQGVNALDFHPTLNLIATAGVNHQVCLWNPYVVSKPNGVLRGHMAAVVQVQYIINRNQLLSFSKDKVLRIWDVGLQICIQRLAGMFPKGGEVQSKMFFDEARNKLFISFNYQLTVMEIKNEVRDRTLTHEKSVVASLYNKTYNQVVTLGQEGNMYVWLLDNGQRVKSNTEIHGEAEVTSLAQDPSETRLCTGATDGTIKVWDFNGHCYHILHCSDKPADLGQIVMLKRTILVIGWTKFITIFRDLNEYHVYPSEWKGGQDHRDDILAAAYTGPTNLATGSYDGEIIIWNTGSEQVSRRLTARMRPSKHRMSVANPSSSSRQSTRFSTMRKSNTPGSRAVSQGSEMSTEEIAENSYAIAHIVFLETRKSSHTSGNLISCGGNGWVRFWNMHTCKLVAEFIAHQQVSSVIMANDSKDKFLITADVDGILKSWMIDDYCLEERENEPIMTRPPMLIAQWSPHVDGVNSLTMLERYGRTLVISASSDYSVVLSDVRGKVIGVFGQEQHWTIQPFIAGVDDDFSNLQGLTDDSYEFSKDSTMAEDEEWRPDSRATRDPTNFKMDSWEFSILGGFYKESRKQKRERRQPATIPDLPYLHWEKTGAPPAGPYSALVTGNLEEVEHLKKPDFMFNPHKFFGEKIEEPAGSLSTKLPALSESLKTSFDEKSLFDKELLDYEHDIKKLQLERGHATAATNKRGSVGLNTRQQSARRTVSKTSKVKTSQSSRTMQSVTES